MGPVQTGDFTVRQNPSCEPAWGSLSMLPKSPGQRDRAHCGTHEFPQRARHRLQVGAASCPRRPPDGPTTPGAPLTRRAGGGTAYCAPVGEGSAKPGRREGAGPVKQIRVHGPNDVRLDDLPAAHRAPATPSCAWRRAGSAAPMSPSSIWEASPGGRWLSATRWPAWSSGPAARSTASRWVTGSSSIRRTRSWAGWAAGAAEGGLTPLLLVREAAKGRRLFPFPEGMELRVAALAEPAAVGMQAVNQGEVAPGDRVAVVGCGPIGLLAIATLADRGIRDVVAIDTSRRRLELAQQFGAADVVNPLEIDMWDELARLHGTAPFMFGPTPATDVFIEASGSDRLLGEILEHGRYGGRMSLVALHYAPVPDELRPGADEAVHHQGLVRISAEVRGRHRSPGATRPVGPDHPHLAARAVRPGIGPPGGFEGLRKGHDHLRRRQ